MLINCLTFTKGKSLIFFFDILYFVIFALATFLFFLATNKGEFRSYMIFGEILGWIFYYLSFGIVAKSFTDAFVNVIHKLFSFLFKIISAPFELIFKMILKIKVKFSLFLKKVEKKTQKNRKKLLPKLRLYVYNLLSVFRKQRIVKKKGGFNDEKENCEQKT